jgi:hypothetical protein
MNLVKTVRWRGVNEVMVTPNGENHFRAYSRANWKERMIAESFSRNSGLANRLRHSGLGETCRPGLEGHFFVTDFLTEPPAPSRHGARAVLYSGATVVLIFVWDGCTGTGRRTSPQGCRGLFSICRAESFAQQFAQLASSHGADCFTIGYPNTKLVRDQLQRPCRIGTRDQTIRIPEKQ